MKLEVSIDNINEPFKVVLSLAQTKGGVEFVYYTIIEFIISIKVMNMQLNGFTFQLIYYMLLRRVS